MLRIHLEPVSEPHILDLVSLPVVRETPSAPPTGSPAITFTPVKVIASVRPQELEADTVERSSPTERSAATSPRVVTRTQEAVRPTTSRPTTIAEHRRLHPMTQATTSLSRPSTGPAKININEVLAPARPGTAQSAPAVDGSQLASYWERLVAQLRALHEKPAELDDGLQARVEFTIRADGTISDVRILKSSGNEVFDASVVAAFRRLGGLGVPPAGSTGTQQITFRTRAE